MYTSSDTKLEWPGEGLLFESDSINAGGHYSSHPRSIIEVRPEALGTHQEAISRRPEQMYTPSEDWNGLGSDHYSSWTRINTGGLKCSHYLSHFLGHY